MLDRTQPPPLREIESFSLRIPEKQFLGNGQLLYTINDPGVDVLKVDICFKGGRWMEEKPGLAAFTAGLLKEGTTSRTSAEINSYFESLGAFIECTSSLDLTVITIYTLKEKLAQVLDRICEILMDADFPEHENSRYLEIQRSRLKINLENTGFVARRKFVENIFGESHPYGIQINDAHLCEIQQSDLQDYFDNIVKSRPFTVFASGSIGKGEIEIIDKYLGELSISKEPIHREYQNVFSQNQYEENLDQAVQSSLYIGMPIPDVASADIHHLTLVNEILGGYFGSRLMKNLREDKGYTYGMYSRLTHLAHGNYFSASADVIKASRKEALLEVEKEILLLTTERVGEEELSTVKNYLLGSFLSSVNSPFSLIQLFRFLHFHELPDDYFDRQVEVIKSINSDEVLETARKYLDPSKMTKVIVG